MARGQIPVAPRTTSQPPYMRSVQQAGARKDRAPRPGRSFSTDSPQTPGCGLHARTTRPKHRGPTKMLQQAEPAFWILFEHSTDALFLLDPHDPAGHWPIIACNTAAEERHGYTRAEMVGQSIDMFNPVPGSSALSPTSLIRQRQMGVIRARDIHRRKDGTLIEIEYVTMLVTLAGQELVLGIERDLTAPELVVERLLKLQDEAQQANRAKTTFLARMSHELRTPLTVTLGYARLLEVKLAEPQVREFASNIVTAGERLLQLIDDVLDQASLAANRLDIALQPVDVHWQLRSAAEQLQLSATERQVHIDLSQVEAGPRWALADPYRLQQVLVQLIENAITFNRPQGKVTVCCMCRGNRMRITVEDTGRGISRVDQAKLFTPFERLGAEQDGPGGLGLGLALAKQLVERMGGTIGVMSTENHGSSFWIELKQEDQATLDR